MAKPKIDELPSLVARVRDIEPTPELIEKATSAVIADITGLPAEVQPLRLATLEVPLGMIDPAGYIPVRERLEAKCMTQQQSIGLLRALRGLQDRGDTLRDGTPIKRGAQAVRWMLEQLAGGQ